MTYLTDFLVRVKNTFLVLSEIQSFQLLNETLSCFEISIVLNLLYRISKRPFIRQNILWKYPRQTFVLIFGTVKEICLINDWETLFLKKIPC